MPDILRVKRRFAGGAAGAPASLASAEIAFNEQDNVLYYGKGNTGGLATSILPIAGPGGFLPLSGGTMSSGISFGAVLGGTNSDLSKHLLLHTAGYGFGITGGRLNLVVASGGSQVFVVAAADRVTVNASGITMGATSDITLVRDGSATMHAVTKRQLDALATRVAYIEARFIRPS
ncbi:MAG TPA: hypothetical protein VL522_23375 [Bordetella sp.]|jgi:hypothetical protein|nr:hypothetical protein [Bordetella sp.]